MPEILLSLCILVYTYHFPAHRLVKFIMYQNLCQDLSVLHLTTVMGVLTTNQRHVIHLQSPVVDCVPWETNSETLELHARGFTKESSQKQYLSEVKEAGLGTGNLNAV